MTRHRAGFYLAKVTDGTTGEIVFHTVGDLPDILCVSPCALELGVIKKIGNQIMLLTENATALWDIVAVDEEGMVLGSMIHQAWKFISPYDHTRK